MELEKFGLCVGNLCLILGAVFFGPSPSCLAKSEIIPAAPVPYNNLKIKMTSPLHESYSTHLSAFLNSPFKEHKKEIEKLQERKIRKDKNPNWNPDSGVKPSPQLYDNSNTNIPWWQDPWQLFLFQNPSKTSSTTRFPQTTTSRPTTTTTTSRPTIPQTTATSHINTSVRYSDEKKDIKCKSNKFFSNNQSRITGGGRVEPNSFPWLALIYESGKHICGGSLIDETHVLTASHCIATLSPQRLASVRVILGGHNLARVEENRQSFEVKTAVRHKRYDRALLYNDIGILTLKSPVKSDNYISPICLYEGSDSLDAEKAVVAGWGSLFEGGPQMFTPRQVELKIWNNENCRITYGRAAPGGIVSSYLCAGERGKDACSGDSGGPITLVKDGIWVQIGLVSWGIGCGRGNYPGIYSRISYFLPWIRKVQGIF